MERKFFYPLVAVIVFASTHLLLKEVYTVEKEKVETIAVAEVNKEKISLREFKNEVAVAKARYEAEGINFESFEGKQLLANIEIKVLNKMVTELLLLQKTREKRIEVSSKEVDREIEKIKRENSFTDKELAEVLKRNKLSLDNLRSTLAKSLIIQKYLDQHVFQDIKASEREVRKYFENNREKFDQPEQVYIRLLVLKDENTAKKVLRELKRGVDFALLARRYSLDPGSKDIGGEIGFISRGKVIPEIEEVAFSLKPSQYSDIVDTPYGKFIIKVEKRKEAKKAVYEEVKDSVREEMLEPRKNERFKEWFKGVRANSKITIYYKPDLPSDEERMREVEKAGLRYYINKYGDSKVTAKARDFGCHIQVNILKKGNVIKELGYAGGTIYEIR